MQTESLFDPSIPFTGQKLALLEQQVLNLNSPQPQLMLPAMKLLEELKTKPEFWLMTDGILTSAQNVETKVFCLMAIQDGVRSKWTILPDNQRTGVKNFIVDFLYKAVQAGGGPQQRLVLNKANSILVEIIKKEWNQGWTSAISDLVKSSFQGQEICENNFLILKELSEEVFDFSKNTMTSQEVTALKGRFASDFQSVYEACDFVLKGYLKDKSKVRLSLLKACMDTLLAFLSWMPLVYIFLTDLIEGILVPLMADKRVYLQALKCLEEIIEMDFSGENNETQVKIRAKLVVFKGCFLERLMNMHPLTRSFETERRAKQAPGTPLAHLTQYDMFCRHIGRILAGFMKMNLEWLENNVNPENLPQQQVIDLVRTGIRYLILLTEVREESLYRQSCDFWLWYSEYLTKIKDDLYGNPNQLRRQALQLQNPLATLRQQIHLEPKFLNETALLLILRVPQPEEILITVDENGIPKKETQKHAQSTQLYQTLKTVFRNYAGLDWGTLREILKFKLNKQFDGTEWSFNNMNSLCWAVGTLANALSKSDEKTFLIFFLRNLLQMCENKTDIESKAIIASNIMHIVSQFSRFLIMNFEFLKTVLYKLLEFMTNKFAGVQEMACNIFLKICERCKNDLARPQPNIKQPNEPAAPAFVISFIPTVDTHTSHLSTFQRIQFYESVGHMISAFPDPEGQMQLTIQLMSRMEVVWQNLMGGLDNLQAFMNEQKLLEISFYLRVNERLAACIGRPYSAYFNRSFGQIDRLYGAFYQLIQSEVQTHGPAALEYFSVKKFRAIRRDLLSLLKTFVAAYQNDQQTFITNYGQIISFMLGAYRDENPALREPEVLLFMAEAVKSLKEAMEGVLAQVMSGVLEAVLPMITTDFSSFPEHRANFFVFVQAMVSKCFQVFFNVEQEQFKTVINCVIWAIKHELPALYNIGLDTLICILECLDSRPHFAETFYQFYFANLLADTLYVLTDGLHTNGFESQSKILHILLSQIPRLSCRLIPNDTSSDNMQAVSQYILKILSENFSNLAIPDHQKWLGNLFSSVQDLKAFRTALRDYLISLKIFTIHD